MPEVFGRKLGVGESMMAKLCARGMELSSAVMFISSHQPLTEAALLKSMVWVMHRHPLLRMSIVEHEGTLYWTVS